MENLDNIEEILKSINGGCSSLNWSTEDNKHLWARNFDFNHIAKGSKITYIPKGKVYYGSGTSIEDNIVEDTKTSAKYAALGTGSLLIKSTPILYEGINEKGLMGGQLYLSGFAKYPKKYKKGKIPLQPSFVVTYMLTQCESVEEIVDTLKRKVEIIAMPILGELATIHWSFSDRTGENIIIESDKRGLHIYRKTMGVMTNSPTYDWQRTNLMNYFNIRNLDYDYLEINGEKLKQTFSGNGATGLPGDFSSPSRFVRLSFLKKYGIKGKNEEEGVTNIIHLLNNVAFPLGFVEVSQMGEVLEYYTDIRPYDFTIYTAVMCSESLRFYWVTYENQRVQSVDLNHLLEKDDYVQFDLDRVADFKYLTKE